MCGFFVKSKYHPITLYSFLLLLELEGSTWEREAAQWRFLLSEENAELPLPRKLSFSVNLIITLCSQEYSVCRAARQALFFLYLKKPKKPQVSLCFPGLPNWKLKLHRWEGQSEGCVQVLTFQAEHFYTVSVFSILPFWELSYKQYP